MNLHFNLIDRVGTMIPIEEPAGWDGTTFELNRDPDTHGIFFDYQGNEYEYRGLAAKRLKAEYDQYGLEGDMLLYITYDCVGEENDLYLGRFDFGAWDDRFGNDCLVKLPVENTTDIMQFRNRMDQKVNLQTDESFDGVTSLPPYAKLPFNTTLPGKSIFAQDEAKNTNPISDLLADVTNDPSQATAMLFVPPFEAIVSDEIGQFLPPNSISSSFDWAYATSPGYTAPAGWVAPSYATYAFLGAAGSEHNKLPLDTIDPIINYSSDVGNTFRNTNFTGDIEFDLNITLNPNIVGPNSVLDACYGAALFMVHRDRYDNLTWIPAFNTSGCIYDPSPIFTSINVIGAGLGITTTLSSFTMKPGDRLYLFVRVDFLKDVTLGTDPPFDVVIGSTNFFKYSGLSLVPPTDANVFMVNEALSRITEAITDDKMRVYSDYFGRTDAEPYASAADGCGSLETITNGLFIRRMELKLPDRPPKLMLSMKDMWEGLNPIHNLGMGPEPDPTRSGYNLMRIENYEYFYDDDVIMNCIGVDIVRRTIEPKEHYSLFKFGYKKWEAEQFNGIDEFLTSREYRTTLSEINNILEKISTFISSGFALEVTRRLANDTSEDWRYDNETFIICMERDGGNIIPEVGGITSPAHIVDPDTIYNFRIRPLYNAMRWLPPVLASYRVAGTGSKIIFTHGDGNYYAEGKPTSSFCKITNTVLSEQADIMPSVMTTPANGLPKWYAENIEYRFPMTVGQWQLVKANPYKLIHFETENVSGDGWIRSIKFRPDEGIADFKLKTKRP